MGASHILNCINGTKLRKTAKWYHISTSSHHNLVSLDRCNSPEVFLVKVVLKICRKFAWEQPCWSVISIKLQSNFIESHLHMGVLLKIYCMFSEYFSSRTHLDGCFCLELFNTVCDYSIEYKHYVNNITQNISASKEILKTKLNPSIT